MYLLALKVQKIIEYHQLQPLRNLLIFDAHNYYMKTKDPIKKIRRKRMIIRIFAWIFLAMQLLAYIGNANEAPYKSDDLSEEVGHHIGYNLFLIISAILFYRLYKITKSLKKVSYENSIDAIGQSE